MPARYTLDATSCIRCASCSSLAPDHFRLPPTGAAQLVRQPVDAAEEARCAMARDNCPTSAIAVVPALASDGEAVSPGAPARA